MTQPFPEEVSVRVYSETRWHRHCSECGGPSFLDVGHATQEEAEAAAELHRQKHRDQPFCICETTCMVFSFDKGEPHVCDPEGCGHVHCSRHRICCECGCLTRRIRDAVGGES